jgi:hypothetical protein
VGVGFSAARSIAVALVAGRLTHEEVSERWLGERAAEIEPLAARVRVRHDWDATLETARGPVDGGASLRDVPLSAWPRVLRRMRELHMDEASFTRDDLRELVRRPALRRELLGVLRSGRRGGIAALDTGAMRLPFPCRLRIRLRSGRVLEVAGEERGGCGAPLSEQREVAAARAAAAGLAPEVSQPAR